MDRATLRRRIDTVAGLMDRVDPRVVDAPKSFAVWPDGIHLVQVASALVIYNK